MYTTKIKGLIYVI